MRRWGLAVVALAAAVAGAAVARADFVLPMPQPPGPNTRIAGDAVDAATQAVAKRDGACQLRPLRPRGGSQTHDPPPQEMLDAFAILRRPATPADDPGPDRLFLGPADRVTVDYVRRARVLPDGSSVFVVPALDALPTFGPRPARCDVNERLALEHRLRGKPAQAQRAARRLLRTLQHSQRELAKRGPTPGIFVEAIGPHGGGGGGGQDVAAIRKYGSYTASSVRGRGSRLVGLVPDGVATIDFTFARGHALGPEDEDRVYRRIYRRTVAVVSNVVVLTVPRAPLDALYNRQVWRAADGSVVNTIKPGF
jgi:hypothetical protein